MNRLHLICLTAVLGLGLQVPLASAQRYPNTGQNGYAPANSQWSVSQPEVIDRPGANAFEPTDFPPQSSMDDISMSPDDWGKPDQLTGAGNDLQSQEYVQRFPGESGNRLNDPQRMQSAGAAEPTGEFGNVPLPPSDVDVNDLPQLPGAHPVDDPTSSADQAGNAWRSHVSPPCDPTLPNRYGTTDHFIEDNSFVPVAPRPRRKLFNNRADQDRHPIIHEGTNAHGFPLPEYRQELGHRSPDQTMRSYLADEGQVFDHEDKKQHYPPMSEIIATGRFFINAEALLIKPYFQNNSAVHISSPGGDSVATYNFDYEFAPAFRAGFESKYGPGIMISYGQYDQNSATTTFTSDGVTTGETSAWLAGPNQWTRLSAAAAGEMLSTDHSLEVHQYSAAFFKELKFPIARLNGMFGIEYINVAHELDAELTSGAAMLGQLFSRSDMKAYGPQVGFEYFRPIGHTKVTLVTKFGSTLLLGNRDQLVTNTLTGDLTSIGADEFITKFDFGFALMHRKPIGENRFVYSSLGFESQSWLNGGTAVHPQSDFGFRALTFTVGINR